MHKTKLTQIILKNLEELKELAEEIINNPVLENSEIDLAISKAQTLQMELEMLKEKKEEDSATAQEEQEELDYPKEELNAASQTDTFMPEVITDSKPGEKIDSDKRSKNEGDGNGKKESVLNKHLIRAIVDRLKSEDRKAAKPISKLQTAIGINDRYFYVREIFNNDVDRFIAVIETLDKLENLEQAIDYMSDELSLKETESGIQFIELVKRRFTH